MKLRLYAVFIFMNGIELLGFHAARALSTGRNLFVYTQRMSPQALVALHRTRYAHGISTRLFSESIPIWEILVPNSAFPKSLTALKDLNQIAEFPWVEPGLRKMVTIAVTFFLFFASSLRVSAVMSCRPSKMPSRRIGRTMNDEWKATIKNLDIRTVIRFSTLQRHQPFVTCSQIWLLPGAARKARRNEGCAGAALSKHNCAMCCRLQCALYILVAQPLEVTWVNAFLRQPGAIPSTTEVSDTVVCLSDSSKCKKERDWWSQGDGQWASECLMVFIVRVVLERPMQLEFLHQTTSLISWQYQGLAGFRDDLSWKKL